MLLDYILAYEIDANKDQDWQEKREEKRREFEANLEKAKLELEMEGIEVQYWTCKIQSCILVHCTWKGRIFLKWININNNINFIIIVTIAYKWILLYMKTQNSSNGKTAYIKIHAPWKVLTRGAEEMLMKMPIKVLSTACFIVHHARLSHWSFIPYTYLYVVNINFY